MRPIVSCFLLVVLALLARSQPGWAENPKISLKLENVTAAEAVAALSQSAGIPVEFYPPAVGAAGAVPAELLEKASFDWTNVAFSTALRQLCARYPLQLSRQLQVYRLRWHQPGIIVPGAGAPGGPPAKPVGLVEKKGVRLFAANLSIQDNRTRQINFLTGQPEVRGSSTMTLTLNGQLVDGDAERIAGIENVVAKDDLGNLLAADARPDPFSERLFSDQFPDEWTTRLSFPAAHPRAKKLAWLEGDLLVYRIYRQHRVEIPLPRDERTARRELGDTVIELLTFQAGEEGDAAFPKVGPVARLRLLLPPGADPRRPVGLDGPRPSLVGASGKTYASVGTGSRGTGTPEGMRLDIEVRFPPIPEPVARMVFRLEEKAEPESLLSFRMQEIPLPAEALFPLAANPPAAPRPVRIPSPLRGAGRPPDRPYFERGGGTLVNQVQLAGQPAGEGTLSLGLAQKVDGEWSGIRWIELAVDRNGVARLEDLKAGTYRLLRIYRPKEPSKVTGTGRWQNGELEIEVPAGKEITPPPLQRLLDIESPRPAPAARPAARPRRR